MPVTITKQKTTKKATTAPTTIAGTIDRAGDLEKQINKLKAKLEPLETEYKAAKAEIVTYAEDTMGVGPGGGTIMNGDRYTLELGQKATKSFIGDQQEVYNALELVQDGLAFEVMKFNVSDLKKYLPGFTLEDLIETKRVGPRKMKIQEKP